MALHPHVERAQSSQQQPRVEWAETDPTARCVRQICSTSRAGSGDDAGRHVGVTAQILCRAVPDEIGAERERSLIDWCGDGVIYDNHCTTFVGRGRRNGEYR